MALASFIALALLTADPQASPAAVQPAGVTAPVKAAVPKSAAERAFEEPLPPGAPEDDYGFVGWCFGALQGHMALFTVVKPDLNALPDPDPRTTAATDAEMLEAGAQYLTLYAKAMDAAERASPQPIGARGADMKKAGLAIWGPAQRAEPTTRMWSWVSWALPGRCEYAAERLYEKSMLRGQALGVNMRTAPVTKPVKRPERNALGAINAP